MMQGGNMPPPVACTAAASTERRYNALLSAFGSMLVESVQRRPA